MTLDLQQDNGILDDRPSMAALNEKSRVRIGGVEFARNHFGMLRQRFPARFTYDEAYLERQSTNIEMAHLRLGWLLGQLPYEELRSCRVLELGPGRGVFFDVVKRHVAEMSGFDVVRSSPYCTVTPEEARRTPWDVVCAFDVLEHFEDIDDLWKLDFRWGYFSIPAAPCWDKLADWRHFKPDEHIWHISQPQFHEWALFHGYELVSSGTPEDCIRSRWCEDEPNINSFLIRRIA